MRTWLWVVREAREECAGSHLEVGNPKMNIGPDLFLKPLFSLLPSPHFHSSHNASVTDIPTSFHFNNCVFNTFFYSFIECDCTCICKIYFKAKQNSTNNKGISGFLRKEKKVKGMGLGGLFLAGLH